MSISDLPYSFFEWFNLWHLSCTGRQELLQVAFDVSQDLFVNNIFPLAWIFFFLCSLFDLRLSSCRPLLLFYLFNCFQFQWFIWGRLSLAFIRSHDLVLDLKLVLLNWLSLIIAIISRRDSRLNQYGDWLHFLNGLADDRRSGSRSVKCSIWIT